MDVIVTHRGADWGGIGSLVLARRLYPNAALALPDELVSDIPEPYHDAMRPALLLRTPSEINLTEVKRLILLDASRPEQIGIWAEIAKRPEVEVHIFSRQEADEKAISGALEVRRAVGSCVTLLAELLQKRNMTVSPTEATWALLGLNQDTGHLSFRTTTADDMRAAAWLMDRGADQNVVNEAVRGLWTPAELLLLHDMLQSSQVHRLPGLTYCWTELAVAATVPVVDPLLERLHRLRGADLTFALLSAPDALSLFAFNESSRIDLTALARYYGAEGDKGHLHLSLHGITISKVRDHVTRFLHEKTGGTATARDLLQPVAVLTTKQAIAEAAQDLVHRRMETAVVVDEDGKLIGVVERATLDLACRHGLTKWTVFDVTDREVSHCAPNTTLIAVQELLRSSRERFLPVMDEDHILGMVERTSVAEALLREAIGSQPDAKGFADGTADGVSIVETLTRVLPDQLCRLVRRVGEVAAAEGVRACLVGGFVRDLLLHLPNLDLDIVVEGDAVAIAGRIADEFSAGLRAHEEFQTATLRLQGYRVDFATARREYYPEPGALPEVTAASMEEDAARRDFTINTLLFDLRPEHFGKIIDPCQGLDDLRRGLVRVLHGLSFVEDPTRLFRAVRFERRFGFRLEARTYSLLESAVSRGLIERLSGRRIWKEMRLIFAEQEAADIVGRLMELNVFLQRPPRVDKSPSLVRISRICEAVRREYPNLLYDQDVVWLGAILLLYDENQKNTIRTRLELPSKVAQRLADAEQGARRIVEHIQAERTLRPSALAAVLRGESEEARILALLLSSRDDVRQAMHRYWVEWATARPVLDGGALRKLGIPEGPVFAEILTSLRDARLDNEVASREEELALVKRLWRERQ